MRMLRAIGDEVVGLFIDDGSLAAAVIVLVGLVAALRGERVIGAPLAGGVLFAGLVVILLENVRRSARR